MDALSIFASRFTPPGAQNGEAISCCIPSLTGSADAFLALTLALGQGGEDKGQRTKDKGRLVLVVTPGLPDADRLADDLRLLTSIPHPPSLIPSPLVSSSSRRRWTATSPHSALASRPSLH